MYIYFFERILRAVSGDPNLALPYWNYSDPAQRALLVPFREPSGAANPLFVSQRNAGINAGAELLGSDVSTTQMFLARNFLPREGSRLSFGEEESLDRCTSRASQASSKPSRTTPFT